MATPIAQWNPARMIWETDQADLFCEQREPYSETWPTSGTTRNGQLLPLPPSEHHTAANGSSLLPTPRASRGASTSETRDALLPTPRATDGTKGGPNQRGSSGDLMLPSAVMRLTE
ncbi:Uncharacterised protein [Mycobacteroides abscessus subsp. bolletii]|nr:Uncharacterised protein [Mycobacteroides abscessus subsp. bolletii]